ncbi:MAG: LD-carboxypeptidase [candidate division KSB1 bacterium]|nr:LD-carboxypeptidase [candidate division KSB1 bacterium]MDZ7334003.1 LD-carboxypeptidase [candidate division KSB1 bacterium]MDZ7357438.1 LD-carboxypeptidase [candidate division KSB1 bacterium]MDZ7375910.1 LD-carboxypeptidase [candidate division KSB1 bacterium]MDZ7399988.1 LD-carboxypeptidase [candidate division KSB1 bacterium]
MESQTRLKPFQLTKNSTIGVVSPASCPADEVQYRQGIAYLESLGYRVVEAAHVLDRRGYLAGNDLDRANDLNAMFRDPHIDAIVCSRGGYGTARLLQCLDYEALGRNPKIFVGYSDITALNLAIWQQTGLVSFSGAMVAVEMGKGIDPFTELHFWRALTSTDPIGLLTNPENNPIQVYHPGKATGILLGGCLSLINVLLGTPYCPDFRGAILFIEDIDEEPYRVDRYLAQLRLAGILDQVAGVVVGQFTECDPRDPEKPSLTLSEIFDDYLAPLNVPIITNFAYGHGSVKHIMPIGVKAILDTELGGVMIPESAVKPKMTG